MRPYFQPGDEERVVIVPYQEPGFPFNFLSWLWGNMMQDNITSLFWADGKSTSLNDFIRFFSPQQNRVLLVPICRTEDGQLPTENTMGAIWIDQIESGTRCFGHFFFFRRFWGKWPEVAIAKAIDCVFASQELALHVIVCQMNERNALGRALMRRIGVQIVGTIPQWYRHGEETMGAVFGYIEKAEWRKRCQSQARAIITTST